MKKLYHPIVCTCYYGYRVMILNIPLVIILVAMTFFIGYFVFAFYAMKECDPFESGQIGNANEVYRVKENHLQVRPVVTASLFLYDIIYIYIYKSLMYSGC